jgi:hypothetical protein
VLINFQTYAFYLRNASQMWAACLGSGKAVTPFALL